MTRLQKLLAERKITLTLTAAAKKFIAKDGFDPAYGARPLKRSIQKNIQDPLSMKLLEGAFKDGDSISVDESKGGIVFYSLVNQK
jgi:ATP-dependent Clp protease ATP-binding subunit ClpB